MDTDTIRKFLDYSPITGSLTWNYTFPEYFEGGVRTAEQKSRTFNARYAGRPAIAATNSHGYKVGRLRYKHVAAHRIIWEWVHGTPPKGEIDHINGDRSDNRIGNLREVTHQENSRNLSIPTRNKSGFVGVRFKDSRNRWEADIRVNGKLKFLGRFKCLGDAIKAREKANAEYGFHPNHGMR